MPCSDVKIDKDTKIRRYYDIYVQEHGLLNRSIYKFKNQHGRLGHFKSVSRINRDLRLFIIAYRETFFNTNSTGDPEIYARNVKDLSRILRRIKWDLKDAGTSISRLLAHGFHLSLVFLLLSVFSRLYTNTTKLEETIKSVLNSYRKHSESQNQAYITNHFDKFNYKGKLNATQCSNADFIDQSEDLGCVVSSSEITLHHDNCDNISSNGETQEKSTDLERNTCSYSEDGNETACKRQKRTINTSSRKSHRFGLLTAWKKHMSFRFKRKPAHKRKRWRLF